MTALLVVLALVWAFAMLPLVFAASFGVLVVSRFVLGLAEGPSSALIHTEAYSWHRSEKRGFPGALCLHRRRSPIHRADAPSPSRRCHRHLHRIRHRSGRAAPGECGDLRDLPAGADGGNPRCLPRAHGGGWTHRPYVTGLIVDAASDPGLGYATAFRIMGIPLGCLCSAGHRPRRSRQGQADSARFGLRLSKRQRAEAALPWRRRCCV